MGGSQPHWIGHRRDQCGEYAGASVEIEADPGPLGMTGRIPVHHRWRGFPGFDATSSRPADSRGGFAPTTGHPPSETADHRTTIRDGKRKPYRHPVYPLTSTTISPPLRVRGPGGWADNGDPGGLTAGVHAAGDVTAVVEGDPRTRSRHRQARFSRGLSFRRSLSDATWGRHALEVSKSRHIGYWTGDASSWECRTKRGDVRKGKVRQRILNVREGHANGSRGCGLRRRRRVAARLVLPVERARDESPCIVMAHGWTSTKKIYLDRFAEVFAQAGLAVLVFDNRGWGDSRTAPGKPRHESIRGSRSVTTSTQ